MAQTKFSNHISPVGLFNSRTAIAGAIIGLLLVFLQFKELELYWGAVFLGLEEEYRRIPFLSILLEWFEAGNETRKKIWSDFGAEQKWRAEQKNFTNFL